MQTVIATVNKIDFEFSWEGDTVVSIKFYSTKSTPKKWIETDLHFLQMVKSVGKELETKTKEQKQQLIDSPFKEYLPL